MEIGYKQCTVCKYDVREKEGGEVEQDDNEDKQDTVDGDKEPQEEERKG